MKKIILLLIITASINVYSQGRERRTHALVGPAYGQSSHIYKGGNTDFPFIPFFSISFGDFYIRGITAGYTVVSRGPRLDIQVSPHLLWLQPDDDPYVNGVKERKWTIHSGLSLSQRVGPLVPSFKLDWDVLGRHKSGIYTFGLNMPLHLGKKLRIVPGGIYKYYLKNYVDYYYGVDADEARTDRAEFQGKSAYEYGPTMAISYSFNESVMLSTMGGYTWLSHQITDSPLVQRSNMYRFYVGLLFSI